ncbi:hypothetical protein CDAR_611861 [Caerostris darwini]|uniref:Uncharacterized protein n=1 Tax=Caerostris darwini TaxID=1538125 RepID=A0AAV4MVL8_9ARAC|nr:hypothetical protein CDAR_611861 [Caerostris darwini]
MRINARGYSRLAYLHSSDGVIKVGKHANSTGEGFRCFIQCLCLGLACETRWSTLGATGRVMQLWIYGCLFSQLCFFGCCSNTSSERKKKEKMFEWEMKEKICNGVTDGFRSVAFVTVVVLKQFAAF